MKKKFGIQLDTAYRPLVTSPITSRYNLGKVIIAMMKDGLNLHDSMVATGGHIWKTFKEDRSEPWYRICYLMAKNLEDKDIRFLIKPYLKVNITNIVWLIQKSPEDISAIMLKLFGVQEYGGARSRNLFSRNPRKKQKIPKVRSK